MDLDLPQEHASLALLSETVDEEHGNPLRLWEAMGKPQALNRQEVRKITEESAVVDEEVPFEYKDGALRLEAELGVNDVYFFQIEMA